jgi:hypothetical protein
VQEFDLVEKKELAPMQELIDTLCRAKDGDAAAASQVDVASH